MAERTAVLTRGPSTPDGTFGDWVSDSGFSCKTVEKPWMDNATDESCIPTGTYQVLWQWSPKHKCNVYHLQNVTGRVAVEIHSANLEMQLQGCIAPGAATAIFDSNSIAQGVPEVATRGVTSSLETLARLEKDMQDDKGDQVPFVLTIKEV